MKLNSVKCGLLLEKYVVINSRTTRLNNKVYRSGKSVHDMMYGKTFINANLVYYRVSRDED